MRLSSFGLALVAVCLCSVHAFGQNPKPVTLVVKPMLQVIVEVKPGGAHVVGVQAGPATNMAQLNNPRIRGLMESGDIITKVNGNAVKTIDDLRDGLAAGDKVIITVWDKNSRKEIDWIVQPR